MDKRINVLTDEDVKDQHVCENVQTTTGITSGIVFVVGHGRQVDATEIVITKEQLRALLHELGEYTIETLDTAKIDNNTIVLIRSNIKLEELQHGLEILAKMLTQNGCHPMCWLLRPEENIELMTEADMNRYGWYRKAQEETGWLIELPTDTGAKWLQHNFAFTANPNKALRFGRKEDAEAVIAFSLGSLGCVATSHMWISDTGSVEG